MSTDALPIILPRSGVTLAHSKDRRCWEATVYGERLVIAHHTYGYWRAYGFGREFIGDTQEAATGRLDEFLAGLREALCALTARVPTR